MDQRTRRCVRRMNLGDIASLPEVTYQRARQAWNWSIPGDNYALIKLHETRQRYIRMVGMDPEVGQRWIREVK